MKQSGTKRGDQLNEVDEASEDEGSQPDKDDGSDELETDSDEEIDSQSEMDSLNADELAEEQAEAYAEMLYNKKRDEQDVNYDHYQFSVAQKYDLTTRALTFKKVKYITDELFLDLKWRMRKTIQFQTSLIFIVFLFFLRQFTHYLGQYGACYAMQVPITKFDLYWYRIEMIEAAWTFNQQAIIVAAGPIANLLLFLLAALSSGLIRKTIGSYPKYFYKVVSWTGLYAVLDPYIVLICDTVSQNYENGDFFKFYVWFKNSGDNGAVGVYLCVFMTSIITLITTYFWYRFMVGYYMNGRILDLYRRLSGNYKAFFVPMDHEVSMKYLQWVITRAKKKNFTLVSEKRAIKDKFGISRDVNFLQILKIDKGMLKKNRLFFKDFDGSIIEVPQKKIFVRTKELKEIRKLNTI